MPSDDLIELVENEVRWRLSNESCETCGRGAEAHEMADTAVAKLANDLARLKLAQQSREVEEREEMLLNPLSLANTVAKLPSDNPTRKSMLLQLEAQVIELQEKLKELRG